MKSRVKGEGYGDYLGKCKKAGEEPISEEDYNELPEEDDDGEESTAKGGDGVPVDALLKSLADYDAVEDALQDTGTSRESFLTARHDAGTITAAERRELGGLWAKSDDYTGTADGDNTELMDASPFLKSMVDGIDSRMDAVADEVLRDGRATRTLLKAQGSLVKGLVQHIAGQDQIIKALGERLGVVEATPAPRRSVETRLASAVEREIAEPVGGDGGGKMMKSDLKRGLNTLMKAAAEAEDQVAMRRITHATSLFENTGKIPANVLEAVQKVHWEQ